MGGRCCTSIFEAGRPHKAAFAKVEGVPLALAMLVPGSNLPPLGYCGRQARRRDFPDGCSAGVPTRVESGFPWSTLGKGLISFDLPRAGEDTHVESGFPQGHNLS